MVVVAWILFIAFGWIGLSTMLNYSSAMKLSRLIIGLVSVIIAALSAGVIWGGLFQ